MGALFSYSVVSAIGLLCMYLAYKWMLASENQHGFNRGVILGIYALALCLPFLPVIDMRGSTGAVVEIGEIQAEIVAGAVSPDAPAVDWTFVILLVYLVGIAVVSAHTAVVIVRLWQLIGSGERVRLEGGYTLVLMENDKVAPFSWWRYVVMSRADYEEAGDLITLHELRHLDACHWLDLLLAQVVVILQWFNPAAWLMREELKTIHEYQADEAVIMSGTDMHGYQMLLIKKAVGARFPSLANSLNHSQLKKRVTMMYKKRSSGARRMRGLAMVPAIAVALIAASIPAVASFIDKAAETDLGITDDKVTENFATGAVDVSENESAQGDDDVTIFIDGRKSSKDEMKKLSNSQIKSIDVVKPENAIYIKTNESQDGKNEAVEAARRGTPVLSINRKDKVADEEVHQTVDKLPEFPGGMTAMMKFLADNVSYPEEAMNANKQGRVVVRFIVGSDGSIKDPEILHGVSPELDAEAMRVIRMMPKFSPGILDGEPVSVSYCIPVSFKLQGDESAAGKKE